MKPPYLKFLALFAISTLLFSCSSSRFASRKYGNRDWIKVEHQPYEQPVSSVDQKSENTEKIVIEKMPVLSNETIKNEIVTTNNIQGQANRNDVIEEEPTPEKTAQKPAIKKKKTVEGRLALISPPQGPIAKKLAELSKPFNPDNTSSEVDQLVIVLLAILIPPLGVYLYDGLSTMFWITLILCLLGGPFLFFRPSVFGLWGVASILAVLYVLGII